MTHAHCAACRATIDMSAIPDEALYAEFGRRRGAKAKNRSGGGGDRVWNKHNPKAANGCRCATCRAARATPEAAGRALYHEVTRHIK